MITSKSWAKADETIAKLISAHFMLRLKNRRRAMSILFLDRAADLSEMFAERVIGICGPLFQVVGELQLFSERLAGFDPIGLFSFGGPDLASAFQNLFDRFQLNKHAAVVIRENDVVPANFEIAKFRDAYRVLAGGVEPLRSGGTRPVTENREADLF